MGLRTYSHPPRSTGKPSPRLLCYPNHTTIHLDLQPELEAQLAAKAQDLGFSTAKYIEQILLSQNEEDERLQEGLADIAAGRTRPAREVFAELHAQYDIHG